MSEANPLGPPWSSIFDLRAYSREILAAVPGSAALTFDRNMLVRTSHGEGFAEPGSDPEALPGKNLPEVLPAPTWAQLKGPYHAALEGHTSTFELVSSGERSYSVHVSPLVAGGQIVGGLVVSHHVSPKDELKSVALTEETLARQARGRAALNLAGVGTWELDLATGETHWSAEYNALYGVDPLSFVPSREAFQELVDPRDRAVLSDALERIARDGVALEVRYRIIRPSDGARRTIRSHIHCELDTAGKAIRLLGTGQDVTDLVLVLSERESEMLMLLAEGLSGLEIAKRLYISPATVRTHINNAVAKLGAHTRGEAIAKALRSQEIGS